MVQPGWEAFLAWDIETGSWETTARAEALGPFDDFMYVELCTIDLMIPQKSNRMTPDVQLDAGVEVPL